MKIISLSIIVCCITIGCHRNSNKKDLDNINLSKISDTSYSKDIVLRRFGLPYAANAIEDSSGVLFYCLGSFDTTYMVHIKNKGNVGYVIYYYVSPYVHRGIDDQRYLDNDLLSYSGLSFTIKEDKWKLIKDKVDATLNSKDTVEGSGEACMDCPFYYLSKNGIFTNSEKHSKRIFNSLSMYLKDSLLYKQQAAIIK